MSETIPLLESHEELLVRRGWQRLAWSAGSVQCIFIIRTLDGADPWRLTPTEFNLTSAIAAGLGAKQAAAELGLLWATARTALNRALRKLGFRSCAHVPAFWHGLSGLASSSRGPDGTELLVFESRLDGSACALALTRAEREVLQAVLVGLDNRQIARERHTSVRTAANQLALLFRKFGVSSKAELAAKALRLSQAGPPTSL